MLFLLWLSLVLAAGSAGPLWADEALYDRDETPTSDKDFSLLLQYGYRFDAEGRLWAPGGDRPLARSDFGVVLEEARSSAKLKALLRINMLLNRGDSSKSLPPEESAEVRRLGSENWELFSKSTRRDLRRFFSAEELDRLNAKLKASGGMAPPPSASVPAKTPLFPAPIGLDAADGDVLDAPRTPARALAAMPPAKRPLALSAVRPAQPKAPPPTEKVAPLPPPWTTAAPLSADAGEDEVVPLPAPWDFEAKPSFELTPAPAPPIPSVEGLDESVAAIAPVTSAPIPISPLRARLAPPAPLSLPWKPGENYPEFEPGAFRAFLESAPYGRDVKPLLELLARHARDPERRIALGLLRLRLPHIILDSRRSGASSAGIADLGNGRHQLALSDGPVLVRSRTLLLSKREFLLPDSPEYYKELGLPVPAEQAFSREASDEGERDDAWGRVRAYRDGSLRLRLSPEQLAGTLLKELLLLDAALRGWDDPYHLELRASAAQFRFYRDWEKDAGAKPVLDRELAALRKAWAERPEEYLDFMIQTLSAHARPSADLRLLEESGALAGSATRSALDKLPQPREEDLGAWVEKSREGAAHSLWLATEQEARKAK